MADTHPHIEVVTQYLAYLRDENFEAAANQFTEDATYLHPPTFRNEERAVGRDDIREYFVESRGARDLDHTIEKTIVEGDSCAVHGYMTGDEVDGEDEYFVSYAEIEDDKMSYYCTGFLKGTIG